MSEIQRKVQIGVNEDQYLAAKWTNTTANDDLVEIARTETIRKHFHNKNL